MNPIKATIIQAILTLAYGCGGASTVHVTWVPPVEREDGTMIQLSEIMSYNVRHKHPSGQSIYETNKMSAQIPILPGLNEYSVQTVDTEGRESEWSKPIVFLR